MVCFFLFADFDQWKESITKEVRLPGGLSTEDRAKVGQKYV